MSPLQYGTLLRIWNCELLANPPHSLDPSYVISFFLFDEGIASGMPSVNLPIETFLAACYSICVELLLWCWPLLCLECS